MTAAKANEDVDGKEQNLGVTPLAPVVVASEGLFQCDQGVAAPGLARNPQRLLRSLALLL